MQEVTERYTTFSRLDFDAPHGPSNPRVATFQVNERRSPNTGPEPEP